MEARPKQDRLLIVRLHREARVPIPFIAMLTVLVGVICIFSYASLLIRVLLRLDTPYRSSLLGSRWRIPSLLSTLGASAYFYSSS